MFNAFADRAAKALRRPREWEKKRHEFDFRVGGRERLSGGPKGGRVHSFDALYQDIVPNERIIYTYDMHLDETRVSVSLATVEFAPARFSSSPSRVPFSTATTMPAAASGGRAGCSTSSRLR